jgi:hypothetical protein
MSNSPVGRLLLSKPESCRPIFPDSLASLQTVSLGLFSPGGLDFSIIRRLKSPTIKVERGLRILPQEEPHDEEVLGRSGCGS